MNGRTSAPVRAMEVPYVILVNGSSVSLLGMKIKFYDLGKL